MKMGLLPLEFTECLQDSPYFRDSLHSHEKELERTSNNIKELIKQVKSLLNAAKVLSTAQRRLAATLGNFKFECIGSNQTDDELIIAGSLKEFSRLINAIEDEKDRMLDQAFQFILPLDNFRKEHIGAVKEGKKKFDKLTAKFCASQERHLGLSRKKQGNVLQDADASLEMEHRDFIRAGLEYVCLIQEVQERKKFEFVETLLGFMYGWLTFYHQGHEVAKDFKPHMTELQSRIQKTRENFNSSRNDIHALMTKMLEVRQSKTLDPGTLNKMFTRSGYLFLMEKKALGTTSWSKCYCHYRREGRVFCMIPYNQTTAKIVSNETFQLKSCIRRVSDSTIDKRFCFDIVPEEKSGVVYTFQALSEEDCNLWMEAMDGKEPMYVNPPKPGNAHHTFLDEAGFAFITRCFNTLESRGLEDQGLYRVVGVTSKVNRLLTLGLDKKKSDKLNFEDPTEVETKTLTSAIKTFLRNLPEPIMTYKLHSKFIAAAKLETYEARVSEVQSLVDALPEPNKRMLELLLRHLEKVSINAKQNMMSVSNLGVCFGPTLLRNEEETVAAIMDIKFGNVVVEILIENWRQILCGEPPRYTSRGPPSRQTSGTSLVGQHQHPGQQGGPPLHHLHHHHPHQLSSSSFNLSGHSVGGSPGGGGLPRPPQPPPYLPPPPPGSSTSSLATLPSTVTLPATSLMSANGIKPTSASLSSPSQLSSSGPTSPHHPPGTPHQQHHPTAAGLSAAGYNTWERGGGAGGGGGSSVGAGGGSTSSLNNNKMFVPQPLGSAPAPLHTHHHPRLTHTMSNSQLGQLIPGSPWQTAGTAPPPGEVSPNNNYYGGVSRGLAAGGPPPPPPVKSRLHRNLSETSVVRGGGQHQSGSTHHHPHNLPLSSPEGGGFVEAKPVRVGGGGATSSRHHSTSSAGGGSHRYNHHHHHQRADEDDPGGLLSSNPVPSSGAAGVAGGGGGTSTSSSTSAIERARFSSSSSSVDSSEASNRAVSEGETNPPSTVLDSSKTLKTRDVMKQGDMNQSRQVATAMKDIESVIASSRAVVSEHAAIFAPSGHGSPAVTAVAAAPPSSAVVTQTATVQPIQQLQQQAAATTSAVTPLSSASPASTTSSSAAAAVTSIHPALHQNSPLVGTGKVRTLYACVGEHESELSFEPNQVITNVRQSPEPGWLQGCLGGRIGLVPENYVEFIT